MNAKTFMPKNGTEVIGALYIALLIIVGYITLTNLHAGEDEILSPVLKSVGCIAVLLLVIMKYGPSIGWEPSSRHYYENMRSPGAIAMELAITFIFGYFCGIIMSAAIGGIFLLTIFFPHKTFALIRTNGESVLQKAMFLFKVVIYGILACTILACIGGVFHIYP